MLEPVFNPRPAQVDAILDAFTAPDRSLRQIAEACNATVPALSSWAARPEIAERIAALDNFAANRARTAATFQLHRAVAVLSHSLDEFEHEQAQRKAARTPSKGEGTGGALSPPSRSRSGSRHPALYDPARRHPLDLREPAEPPIRIPKILDPEDIRRSRDSARRAAALLYHIARFVPPRPVEAPVRRGALPSPMPQPTPRAERQEARPCHLGPGLVRPTPAEDLDSSESRFAIASRGAPVAEPGRLDGSTIGRPDTHHGHPRPDLDDRSDECAPAALPIHREEARAPPEPSHS